MKLNFQERNTKNTKKHASTFLYFIAEYNDLRLKSKCYRSEG